MAELEFRIDLGKIDVSVLETEEDLRMAAQRLLPIAIVQIGESLGEGIWDEAQHGLKGVPGMELNSSSGDRRRFAEEAGRNYANEVSSEDRNKIEEILVKQLRDHRDKTD